MPASVSNAFLGLLLTTFLVGREEFASGEIHFKKGSPLVKLANNGLLSGKVLFSREGRPYHAFMGIPYATIPERFAEAQLATEPSWEGVKSAVTPGKMCTQAPFPTDSSQRVTTFGEEDCLNLNVYVPMNNTGKRGFPVMVWIHGGGFMFGGGYGYCKGGRVLEKKRDFITNAWNAFQNGVHNGTFCHWTGTGDSVVPGNNGLKDVVISLRWVQENIKRFGGDPGKVTIYGESAGGGAVHYLLLSPTTKGLFHRAISQSGSALSSWAYYANPKELAVKLATHMKCPTTAADPSEISSEEILVCLRQASNKELNEAQFSFKTSWPNNIASFYFGPAKESDSSSGTPFITESPYAILTDRNLPLAEVPWMVGMTEDEGCCMFAGIVLSKENLTNELDTTWNDLAPTIFDFAKLTTKDEASIVADKLRQFYFGSKPISADTRDSLTNIYSDQLVGYGVYKSAIDTAARGKRNPVYLYQYAHPSPMSLMGSVLPCAKEEQKKVGHGDEMPFQFDFGQMMPDGGEGTGIIKTDSEHEEVSKHFVKLWTSFAIHGEPKHSWGNSAERKWKAISRKEVDGELALRWYRIEANPRQIDDPYKERLSFWDQLHKDHFEKILLSSSSGRETAQKTEL